jgi:putative hemolysin
MEWEEPEAMGREGHSTRTGDFLARLDGQMTKRYYRHRSNCARNGGRLHLVHRSDGVVRGSGDDPGTRKGGVGRMGGCATITISGKESEEVAVLVYCTSQSVVHQA